MFNFIKKTYFDLIVAQKHDVNFWILCSFLPTFLFSRFLIYIAPHLFINIRGTHIHHLTYGIFLLAIAGFLAQNVKNPKWHIQIAVLYGIGLALAFDEFGMWLRFQDNYWIRISYDAILVISSFLINAVYFSDFWLRILKRRK